MNVLFSIVIAFVLALVGSVDAQAQLTLVHATDGKVKLANPYGGKTVKVALQSNPAAPAPKPAFAANVAPPKPAPKAAKEERGLKPVQGGYVVRPGDSFSKLYGSYWRSVCAEVYPGQPASACNRLEVGKVLPYQPIQAGTAKAKPTKLTAAKVKAKVRPDVCGPDDFCWEVEGGKPYKPHRTPSKDDDVLVKRGLTLGQSLELKAKLALGLCEDVPITRGQRYEWMVFGDGEHHQQVVAAFDSKDGAKRCKLAFGDVVIDVPKKCDNIAKPVLPEPKEVEPPPAPEPQPQPQPEPITPPPPAKPQGCDWDPRAVIGQEHERHSHSTYLSSALYCTWRGEHGTHGVGGALRGSWWNGTVPTGGKYRGSLVGVGPAYAYVSDNHWDMSLQLIFATERQRFRQDDYQSHRDFRLVGPALEYSNYARGERGEKWFPEFQLFGILGLPTSKDVGHTWQGAPIEDVSALDKYGLYFNAGARQYVYDHDFGRSYVSGGVLLETPDVRTANIRVGLSDPDSIIGVHVGYDFDLKNGGSEPGVGFWVDLAQGVKVIRTKHRQSELESHFEQAGVAVADGLSLEDAARALNTE